MSMNPNFGSDFTVRNWITTLAHVWKWVSKYNFLYLENMRRLQTDLIKSNHPCDFPLKKQLFKLILVPLLKIPPYMTFICFHDVAMVDVIMWTLIGVFLIVGERYRITCSPKSTCSKLDWHDSWDTLTCHSYTHDIIISIDGFQGHCMLSKVEGQWWSLTVRVTDEKFLLENTFEMLLHLLGLTRWSAIIMEVKLLAFVWALTIQIISKFY